MAGNVNTHSLESRCSCAGGSFVHRRVQVAWPKPPPSAVKILLAALRSILTAAAFRPVSF